MTTGIRGWVDGQAGAGVPITDRGLQFGDGVFRTVSVDHGVLLDGAGQIAHLCSEAGALGLTADWQALDQEIAAALATVEAPRMVMKIMLTRRQDQRGYRPDWPADTRRILMLAGAPQYPDTCWTAGVRVSCLPGIRVAADLHIPIKHLNRMAQVLAQAEMAPDDHEAWLCNASGQIVCGTMSNVFAVIDGVLVTPPGDAGANHGRMRARVLALAESAGCPIRLAAPAPGDLAGATEIFCTNSLMGIWPVAAWRDTHGTMHQCLAPGPMTSRLMADLAHPWTVASGSGG